MTYAAEFTRRYQSATDIYVREAECLQVMFTHHLLPLRQGDLVAGRALRLPIGVRPQCHGGVGYYLHEPSLTAAVGDGTLTAEERAEADAIFAFWQTENTAAKIADAYPAAWLDIFVHNVPYDTPTAAHALYRISGIQMDPTRLLTLGVEGMIALCEEKKADNPAFYHGLIRALEILSEVCLRYADEAKALGEDSLAADLTHIACHPAATFTQALQLSYLFFVLSGTWNYGRMDKYLGGYLAADLSSEIGRAHV